MRLSKHHLSECLSRVNSTERWRKTLSDTLLKKKKPGLLVCSYISVLTLSLLSFLGKTEAWNPDHLLAPQVQQEHLRTDLLQLLSSTEISRCMHFQGTSNHRKAAFQKVCHLLFRLKKLKREREKKKWKKLTFGIKTKRVFLFCNLF